MVQFWDRRTDGNARGRGMTNAENKDERRWREMKCPYCKGKNLYLKRTSPDVKYGCRDCEKKVKYLRECGLTDKQIEKVLKRG